MEKIKRLSYECSQNFAQSAFFVFDGAKSNLNFYNLLDPRSLYRTVNHYTSIKLS